VKFFWPKKAAPPAGELPQMRIRLLPVLCAAAALLLALKVANVALAIGDSGAAQAAARPQVASAATPASPPAGKGAPDAPVVTDAKPAESPRAAPPTSFSPAEIEVLQSLAQRRAELDRRNEELQQREVLLKATEQRINDKIAQLQSMEKAISETVRRKDEENEAKIKNLVRIYETMKPKEAARIFEQLDMPVLLDVAGHMKEMKVAPILAAMDAGKAKALTLALADRKPPAPAPSPAK
jgi:flagellar motility protein MotE (MotC chaperone)